MADTPLVSIVIINWNRLEDVLRCLHYLRVQRGVRHEIVIVDNGSIDGSPERLSQIECIKLIRLESNMGPAKARNIGVDRASGKYILFLDSDAVLSKVALAHLVDRMERDPSVGIAGCRILNGYTRKIDQWFYQYSAATHERVEFDTYSFSAAGAMIRAEALRAAGPFWDDLFIYNEEVDLSIRVLRAGYRIIYYPVARVYHCPASNGRSGSSTYWSFQIRNWIWIFYRYYSPFHCAMMIAEYTILYLIKGLLNGHLTACIRGIRAGLASSSIRQRYPDKLTREERVRIHSLSRRLKFRFGRG
jgi:GT2 family glycosyltransferase